MNKIVKWTTPLVMGCALMNATPAYAGVSTEAPAEFAAMIASYTNKIGQTFNFVSIISQVTTFTDTMGLSGINAVSSLFGSTSGLMGPFQDSLHFTDSLSFSGLLGDGLGGLGDQLGGLTGQIGDAANGLGLGDISGQVGDMVSGAQGQIGNVVSGVQGQIGNAAGNLGIGDISGQIGDAVKGAQGQINDVVKGAQDQIADASEQIKGVVDGAQDKISDTLGGSTQDQENSGTSSNGEGVKTAGTGGEARPTPGDVSTSAYARVNVPTGMFGQPQKDKTASLKYVKDTFFYSEREGDVFEGKKLEETRLATDQVNRNRLKYFTEITASSYAIATEHAKNNTELSKERLEQAASSAASAETFDDKKAALAAITQAQIREQMTNLDLDLKKLELAIAKTLLGEPKHIVIARSPEQIEQETKELAAQVDYSKTDVKKKEEQL